MITPEIIDYIKSSLTGGLDNEAIKTELRIKGLTNDEIDDAFASAARSQASENPTATAPAAHPTRREIFIGLTTLVILASAILIFYFSRHHGGQVLGSFIR